MVEETTLDAPPEGTPFTAGSAEESDAALDAALDKFVSPSDEEEEVEESATEEPVEAVRADDDDDEDETEEETEESAPEPELKVNPEELSRAYEALLRDGIYSPDELGALREKWGDDVFITKGLKRAEVQKNTDALYASSSRDKVPEEEPDARSTQGEPAPAESPPSNLRELASPFLEAIDTGDSDAASAALERYTTAVTADMRERLDQAIQLVTTLAQTQVGEWREGATRELLGTDAEELMGDRQSDVDARFQELFDSPVHQDKSARARIVALTRMAIQEANPSALERAANRQSKGSAPRKPKTSPARPTRRSRSVDTSELTAEQKQEHKIYAILDSEGPLSDKAAEDLRTKYG